MKDEKDSKAELATLYNRSADTIRKWINYLAENYKRLAQERNDPDYLAFENYNPNSKILTPLQIKVFKKHHGEP